MFFQSTACSTSCGCRTLQMITRPSICRFKRWPGWPNAGQRRAWVRAVAARQRVDRPALAAVTEAEVDEALAIIHTVLSEF